MRFREHPRANKWNIHHFSTLTWSLLHTLEELGDGLPILLVT